VLGIDLSAPMLARARATAAAEGVANARFRQGDAQVYPFPTGGFDVAISRFGVMFIGDLRREASCLGSAGWWRVGGRLRLLGGVVAQQTRPRLWVHISVGSVAEKSGSRTAESTPWGRTTHPMRAEPFEETILAQESSCSQPGPASDRM